MRSATSLRREAHAILLRHCEPDRLSLSVMPGLHLMRFGWASLPVVSTQSPCLALVIQGTKSVEFAGTHLAYGAGQYVLASVDVPAATRIVNASRTRPLLAMAIDIDFAELRQLIERCHHLAQPGPRDGLAVFSADIEILETIVRLLRLLDTPEHAPPLAPLIRQELWYRLLTGPAGFRLLEICQTGSPSHRITEATAWIQRHFADGFMVEELARHVGMSPSSLHQHFKSVTGMTPIQYQKRIRLQEARKRLLFDSLDIGEASFQVGYQSHSQFTKDYREYFGCVPREDVAAGAHRVVSIDAYAPYISDRSASHGSTLVARRAGK